MEIRAGTEPVSAPILRGLRMEMLLLAFAGVMKCRPKQHTPAFGSPPASPVGAEGSLGVSRWALRGGATGRCAGMAAARYRSNASAYRQRLKRWESHAKD
jgi:hypothetical protein